MTITWMGQAGLLFETDGKKIVIDPYLTDFVTTVNPRNYRRVPAVERFFDIEPDIVICVRDESTYFSRDLNGRTD